MVNTEVSVLSCGAALTSSVVLSVNLSLLEYWPQPAFTLSYSLT